MQYRYVILNSAGEDWSCASDVEAVERAGHDVPPFGAELWRGDRRLSVFAGALSADRGRQDEVRDQASL